MRRVFRIELHIFPSYLWWRYDGYVNFFFKNFHISGFSSYWKYTTTGNAIALLQHSGNEPYWLGRWVYYSEVVRLRVLRERYAYIFVNCCRARKEADRCPVKVYRIWILKGMSCVSDASVHVEKDPHGNILTFVFRTTASPSSWNSALYNRWVYLGIYPETRACRQ